MEEGGYALIEMLLVFGGVLAFLVWEFVSVRRARRRDREARDTKPSGTEPEG